VKLPGGPAAVIGDEILKKTTVQKRWEGEESRLIHKSEDDFSKICIRCVAEQHILILFFPDEIAIEIPVKCICVSAV